MKYAPSRYEMTAQEHDRMLYRRIAYVEDFGFTGSVFLTLVSPYGAKRNEYSNDVQSEVTLDDLFKE